MLDPFEGRLKVDEAEDALGIDDEGREFLKQVALLRLIRARLGITDAEIETQYEQDLKNQIHDSIGALGSLIHGGVQPVND